MMTPNTRKFVLAAHITVSVGWIGAVLAYLALVVDSMIRSSDEVLRAMWIALELIGWYVIVPLALAALITGIGIALGTRWGLIRHYWVAVSLVLTALSTAILLQHMSTVTFYAGIAADPNAANAGEVLRSALRGELLHAGVGLVILVAIACLNVYKPRGVTVYGRKRSEAVARSSSPTMRSEETWRAPARTPRWVYALWIHAAALLVFLAIAHVAGGLRLHH